MGLEHSTDDEISDEPMTAEELAYLRNSRQQSDYNPAASSNPLHENWTDDEIPLLAPLWNSSIPLDTDLLNTIIVHHPVLVARPGQPYYKDVFLLYARYCLRHYAQSGIMKWKERAIQIAEEFDFPEILSMAEPQSRTEEKTAA